jgi:hypothetical protein
VTTKRLEVIWEFAILATVFIFAPWYISLLLLSSGIVIALESIEKELK